MNNIEILEDYLKYIKNFDNNSTFIPALENLIKEYKDVNKEVLHWIEKYNLEHEKYMQLYNKKIDTPIIEATEELLKQYIPKSKVKEKLEELKKQVKKMENEDIGVGFTLGKDWSDKKAKIQGYKELLED